MLSVQSYVHACRILIHIVCVCVSVCLSVCACFEHICVQICIIYICYIYREREILLVYICIYNYIESICVCVVRP